MESTHASCATISRRRVYDTFVTFLCFFGGCASPKDIRGGCARKVLDGGKGTLWVLGRGCCELGLGGGEGGVSVLVAMARLLGG